MITIYTEGISSELFQLTKLLDSLLYLLYMETSEKSCTLSP